MFTYLILELPGMAPSDQAIVYGITHMLYDLFLIKKVDLALCRMYIHVYCMWVDL